MTVGTSAGSQRRYWAFISYSHRDRSHADWLHHALETFRIPSRIAEDLPPEVPARNRLSPVFMDRVELSPTHDMNDALRSALADSRWLIVICSPAAVASAKVAEEVAFFRERFGIERILALVVAGRPNAVARGQSAEEECLPVGLRSAEHGGTAPSEPLAADARGDRGAKRDALLRLAASMLEVRLDELVQREAQRRYRRLAALTGVSLAGMAVTSTLAVYAVRQQHRAETESLVAQATTQFLTEVFTAPSPEEGRGSIRAVDVLDHGARLLRTDLGTAPEARARIAAAMGRAYRHLAEPDKAEPLAREAVEYWEQRGELANVEAIKALTNLAQVYRDGQDKPRADEVFRRVAAILDAQPLSPQHADAYAIYADFAVRKADFTLAEQLLRKAEAALATTSEESMQHDRVYSSYSLLYRKLAKFERSQEYALRRLELVERLKGPEHPATARVLDDVGMSYYEQGDAARSEPYFERALALQGKLYGPDHPEATGSLLNLAIAKAMQGKFAEAEPLFRRNLERSLRVSGTEHVDTGYAYYNLGNLLGDMQRYEEAIEVLENSQRVWEKTQGLTHPDVAFALDLQAQYLIKLGRIAQARPMVERALTINTATYKADHPNVARSQLNMGRLLILERNFGPAAELLARALATMERTHGADYQLLADYLDTYAQALEGVGRTGEAADVRQKRAQLDAAS
jgi:hypothetical protein